MALQIGFAALFVCGWHRINRLVSRQSLYPLIALPLGLLFWLLAAFVLVAKVTLRTTDGVDGLAAGTAAIALLGLGILVAPQQ